MPDHLSKILEIKKAEVAELYQELMADRSHPLRSIMEAKPSYRSTFAESLAGPNLAVIAEIKRRSPSAGAISSITDPVNLAKAYSSGGASAISVLTDSRFFGGSLEDLRLVAQHTKVPILRKDFIIDPLQIAEAAYAHASAVLLIVTALGAKIGGMLKEVKMMGLEALVEVHDRDELNMAIDAGARIIGVNNRSLSTFEVDLSVAESLSKDIPNTVIRVAESGINTLEDAMRMRDAGYDAVLIGEALVRSRDPGKLISSIRQIG